MKIWWYVCDEILWFDLCSGLVFNICCINLCPYSNCMHMYTCARTHAHTIVFIHTHTHTHTHERTQEKSSDAPTHSLATDVSSPTKGESSLPTSPAVKSPQNKQPPPKPEPLLTDKGEGGEGEECVCWSTFILKCMKTVVFELIVWWDFIVKLSCDIGLKLLCSKKFLFFYSWNFYSP